MQIVHGVRSLSTPFNRSVLTIGNFDGVHLGHRVLFEQVRTKAKMVGIPSIVMTFDPHPVKVLYPDRGLHRIFDFEDQREQLEALGIDYLVVEPFSREFSQLSPARYIQDWIFRPFGPELLVVGYDFTFGANKGGTIDLLKEKAVELGFEVSVVPPFKVGEHLVSSSRIRNTISEGDVRLAEELLGRRFYLRGLVGRGAGRGRKIGIPTANLHTDAETLPLTGVYAAWAHVSGKRHAAAVNIGHNPTFQSGAATPLAVEAHLLDFDRDIYGENLKLEFVERIRDEKKFSSAENLVAQIKTDILQARKILTQNGG